MEELFDVRFGSEADMCSARGHVRFTPESDQNSGHRGLPMRAELLPSKIQTSTPLLKEHLHIDPTGTEGTPSCNYGRRCGILKANDRDVGAILISENLAVPLICGQTRCPPTPKPWCG